MKKNIFAFFLLIVTTSSILAQEAAQQLYSQGIEILQKHKYEAAEQFFSRAIELEPDFAKAYFERSKTRLNNQRNIDGALADIEKVIELNPDNGAAYFVRSRVKNSLFLRVLGKVGSMSQEEGQKYEKPILEDLNLSIAYGYKTVESYNIRASLRCHDLHLCREAIPDYDAAINLEPDNLMLYVSRSHAKAEAEDLEGSIQDLLEVINRYQIVANKPEKSGETPIRNHQQINKLSVVMALVNLSGRLLSKGDQQIALNALNQAIELEPNFAGAYSSRGRYQVIFGDLQSALADFDKVLELSKNRLPNPQNFIDRGIVLNLQGDLTAAQNDFDKAVEIEPNSKNQIKYFLELTRRQRAEKKIQVQLPK